MGVTAYYKVIFPFISLGLFHHLTHTNTVRCLLTTGHFSCGYYKLLDDINLIKKIINPE